LNEDWTSICWDPTVLTEVPEISYTTEPPKFTPPPVDQLPALDVVGDIAALATDSVTVHTVEHSVSDNSNSLVLTETEAAQTATTSITTNNKHVTVVSEESTFEAKRRRIHLPTLSPNSTMSNQSSSEVYGSHLVPAAQTLRHDSVDSAKDSGIEDSTTTHSAILTMSGDNSCPATTPSADIVGHPTPDGLKRTISSCDDDDSDDSFGEDKSKPSKGGSNSEGSNTSSPHKESPWHHQLNKVSLSTNLPENSYCRLANRNYIFTGAEVFMCDLERFSDDRNIHSNSLF
jgi:hypothetical protein